MVTDKYFEDFVLGETTKSADRAVTDDDIRAYCASAQIDQPIHKDALVCLKLFGRPNLLAPGCMILGIADGISSQIVSPTEPYSPHYGYEKIRFIRMVFGDDILHCEFKLAAKNQRDDKYGMLTFENYIKKQSGEPVIFFVDKILVPYRTPQKGK